MKIIENIDGQVEVKVEPSASNDPYITLSIDNAETALTLEQWEKLKTKTDRMVEICQDNQDPPAITLKK